MEKYFTVVYVAQNAEELEKFFAEEVRSKICAIDANKDLPIQVTSYAVGDVLLKLEQLREAQ
jgi:hypothetical protein